MTDDDHNGAKIALDKSRLVIDEKRVELEKARVALDKDFERLKLEHHKISDETKRGVFDAGIRFADMALRALLIINGGAAVALLTFAGNAGRLGIAVQSGRTFAPLITFGAGAAISIMTAFLAYVAQMIYFEVAPHERGLLIGNRVRAACVACGIASWLLFCVGLYFASKII
jgi:hypothetical protein